MHSFKTPSSRWAALTCRDPSAANAFIYCVITTKIYCRPTCPSRLARRANIIFHNTAAEAEADGFRPCKRCRPTDADEKEGDPQVKAVMKAKNLIRDEEEGKKWSVKDLAKEVGLTESHFCRVFRKITGMTVGEYRASLSSTQSPPSVEGLRTPELETPGIQLIQLDDWRMWPNWVMDDQSRSEMQVGNVCLDGSPNCFTPKSALPWTSGGEFTSLEEIGGEDCFQFLDFDSQMT